MGPCSTQLPGTGPTHLMVFRPSPGNRTAEVPKSLSKRCLRALLDVENKSYIPVTWCAQMWEHNGIPAVKFINSLAFSILSSLLGSYRESFKKEEKKNPKCVILSSETTTNSAGSWAVLEARQAISMPVEINTPTKHCYAMPRKQREQQ